VSLQGSAVLVMDGQHRFFLQAYTGAVVRQ